METGTWYREKTFNQKNGKDEWKYYYVKDIIPETGEAEIDIYRIYHDGRVSEPRTGRTYSDLLEQMARVSEEYACSELHISPPG